MDREKVQQALQEAVNWSNWHFLDQNWNLSEYWHLRAVELHELLHGPTDPKQRQ